MANPYELIFILFLLGLLAIVLAIGGLSLSDLSNRPAQGSITTGQPSLPPQILRRLGKEGTPTASWLQAVAVGAVAPVFVLYPFLRLVASLLGLLGMKEATPRIMRAIVAWPLPILDGLFPYDSQQWNHSPNEGTAVILNWILCSIIISVWANRRLQRMNNASDSA
jgi:hypothetical protein